MKSTVTVRASAACPNCKTVWEPFEPDQIWDKSDPNCSFKQPCNNCAFRKGSPERNDPHRWAELEDAFESGAAFYCHKGVPIKPDAPNGFAYPERGGKPDQKRLRLCRRYLNAIIGRKLP